MDGQQIAALLRESQAAKIAAEHAADTALDLVQEPSVPFYVQQRALANYLTACSILSREIDRAERLARSKKEPAEAQAG